VVTVVHGNTYLSLGERRRELHDAYVMYSIQYSVYEYAWPGTEEPVHWFDIGMTIALLLSGMWGCLRGLIRAMLSLIGLVAASVLAVRGYPDIAQRLAPFIATLWVRQAIGFALIFLAVMAVVMGCSALLRFALRAAGLSLMDRLLGGLFGLAKVFLVASVLLMMADKFFPSVRVQLEASPQSMFAPLLFRSAEFLAAFLEKQNAVVQQLQRQIR
jgi:membrane protein required for colicin V production